jgi:Holliday junction DNA helicase RuvB
MPGGPQEPGKVHIGQKKLMARIRMTSESIYDSMKSEGAFVSARKDEIDLGTARQALARLEVDEHGFDELDRRILATIIEKFGGGPVGVGAIAASLGEDRGTLEDLYEPYLLQAGFLQRTPRGRVASPAAYRHLGIVPPKRDGELF